MLNCTELQGQNLWWKTHPNLVNKKSLPSVLSKNSKALSWSGNSISDFLLRLHSGDIVNRTPTFPFFGSEYRVEELLQELMFVAAVARPAAFIATPPSASWCDASPGLCANSAASWQRSPGCSSAPPAASTGLAEWRGRTRSWKWLGVNGLILRWKKNGLDFITTQKKPSENYRKRWNPQKLIQN